MLALCAWYQCLFDAVAKVLAPVVKGLINMIFQPILDAISAAVTVVMGTIGTFWVYVPTVSVGSTTTGAPANDTVGWIWAHTQFIAVFVAVIGVMVGAIQMAWSHRGEAARDILRSLITLAVAAALSIAVAQALIEFGDKFSDCLVTTALSDSGEGWRCGIGNTGGGKSFGQSMTAMLAVSATVGPIGIGLAITIGVLAIVAGVIQIVLMVVRSAMLILLLGVLPISAAATNTEMGRTWFKRIVSWLLAFILYKPVAAIVYATAIRLTSNNGKGLNFADSGQPAATQIMNMVTGLTMLVLALFALPALMRFIVPMVAATAGGAGAGMLAAKMTGMDQLAQKAQQSADGQGDSGSGSGDGPSGARNVGRPAGPVGIAVVAGAAAVKKGVEMTQTAAQTMADETLGDGESGGGGGGGGGGGPSGSGGRARDMSRDNERARAQQQQSTRSRDDQSRRDAQRDSDGPRGSG